MFIPNFCNVMTVKFGVVARTFTFMANPFDYETRGIENAMEAAEEKFMELCREESRDCHAYTAEQWRELIDQGWYSWDKSNNRADSICIRCSDEGKVTR